jgi:hypothetical protein
MELTGKPEILMPRARRGGKAFDDENLDLLSHVLDDWFRIPGTTIRFGLDGIVGFIPGVGDAIGGIASCVIILAGWMRGVSYVTLSRMIANWGIEVVLGMVPFVGNLFDIGWKANRRNYALLTGSLADPQGVKRRSWFFFAGLCILLGAMLILPLMFFAWLSVHLEHIMEGHG